MTSCSNHSYDVTVVSDIPLFDGPFFLGFIGHCDGGLHGHGITAVHLKWCLGTDALILVSLGVVVLAVRPRPVPVLTDGTDDEEGEEQHAGDNTDQQREVPPAPHPRRLRRLSRCRGGLGDRGCRGGGAGAHVGPEGSGGRRGVRHLDAGDDRGLSSTQLRHLRVRPEVKGCVSGGCLTRAVRAVFIVIRAWDDDVTRVGRLLYCCG